MARKTPDDRFDQLVRVATEEFIQHGYDRAQMADIAAALGLAKGTLYVYVESKEALFALCLRNADRKTPVERPANVPVATPKPGELLRGLRKTWGREANQPLLAEAEKRERAEDPRAELEAVLREMYQVQESHCHAIKLLDHAQAHSEVSVEWESRGRGESRARLEAYLRSRIAAGQFRAVTHPRLTARLIVEVIATWALHIKWDRHPQQFDLRDAEDNAIEFMMRSLLDHE